jgi:hypothetical protein
MTPLGYAYGIKFNNPYHFCKNKIKKTLNLFYKMAATIITTEDLREFKMELLNEIKQLLNNQSGRSAKKWLKSQEVMDLLGISPGTLQNLRVNGTLPYTKIGGVLYYDYQEIMEVLEKKQDT